MSAIRRLLQYAFLAGCAWCAAILFTAATVKRPVVVLIPDTLGLPMWAVARPDSSGLRCVIEWWPARQVDR